MFSPSQYLFVLFSIFVNVYHFLSFYHSMIEYHLNVAPYMMVKVHRLDTNIHFTFKINLNEISVS